MTANRTDNRLDEVPLQPLRCQECAARALVRKSSRAQTSVQWNAEARSACQELGASPLPGPALAGCSRLRETIDAAVASGELHVVETQLV
ncbi:ferredoxin [Nocardia cyriacigeorgica]|uniref:Ferredoxin n=1 Tax=Nocardia cyriacigeorgica TaxID=135487 RepID=A0A6P1CT08_9NOCA|nr:ferredoxin [Nocardia cyriacigeorgica]NEW35688.1 ferredoxin [Nocardia cyriacigeorgica]